MPTQTVTTTTYFSNPYGAAAPLNPLATYGANVVTAPVPLPLANEGGDAASAGTERSLLMVLLLIARLGSFTAIHRSIHLPLLVAGVGDGLPNSWLPPGLPANGAVKLVSDPRPLMEQALRRGRADRLYPGRARKLQSHVAEQLFLGEHSAAQSSAERTAKPAHTRSTDLPAGWHEPNTGEVLVVDRFLPHTLI